MAEKLTVLDPVGEPPQATAQQKLAVRVGELNGKVVGFLINEEGDHLITNFAAYCDGVEQRLKTSYTIPECVRRTKPSLSRPAPKELIDELAQRADLVVNGIGK